MKTTPLMWGVFALNVKGEGTTSPQSMTRLAI